MNLDAEVFVARLITVKELFLDVRHSGGGHDRGHDVLQRHDAVEHLTAGDLAGPADQERCAEAAFPAEGFLTTERALPRGAIVSDR